MIKLIAIHLIMLLNTNRHQRSNASSRNLLQPFPRYPANHGAYMCIVSPPQRHKTPYRPEGTLSSSGYYPSSRIFKPYSNPASLGYSNPKCNVSRNKSTRNEPSGFVVMLIKWLFRPRRQQFQPKQSRPSIPHPA